MSRDAWTAATIAGRRRLAFRDLGDVGSVSTIWLGLDLGFSWPAGGPPVIFETMIFGGPLDGYCERWTTEAEARAGHRAFVRLLRGPGRPRRQRPGPRPARIRRPALIHNGRR